MDNLPYVEIAAIAGALLYVLAIVAVLEAVMKTRTAQGAIAWSISLISMPLITVPLYFVFGRKRFDGYHERREQLEAELAPVIAERIAALKDFRLPAQTPLYTGLYALARMPRTTGNEVELLVDGEQTFDSIAEGLERAKRYILFQFYIIRDDDLGRRIGKLLSDRARAGVPVYLIYDEIGSYNFGSSRLCKQLRMTGVQVVPFNTTQGRSNRLQLNFRNHRKVVVVDGEETWIGGHNVGDEYLGKSRRHGPWRDTHLHLRGPGVLGAMAAFTTDWYWATNSVLDIEWKLPATTGGDSEVLVFPSDPASEYEEAGLMYHQMIVEARERIWIASPYFVPDRAIVSALQLAALRGVDVRIIIPDNPDGPVVAMANWSYVNELLPVGVKIYRYKEGFMHQKVLLMDDCMAGIGTANFDNRSFRLNFEITVLVDSQVLGQQVSDMLELDMARCTRITQADIDSKPPWFPILMGLARLFSPVL